MHQDNFWAQAGVGQMISIKDMHKYIKITSTIILEHDDDDVYLGSDIG